MFSHLRAGPSRLAPLARTPRQPPSHALWLRSLHDTVRGATPDGTPYKVTLKSPKVVGIHTSRGERTYLEDATAVFAIDVDRGELLNSLPRGTQWYGGSEPGTEEVAFVGIFDGHGGTAVSQFLRDNLAAIVESVTPDDIPAAVEATEALGGYFRRWRGGVLNRWTKWAASGAPAEKGTDRLNLDERLTLAYLKADHQIQTDMKDGARHCGSTASVVLIQSLDKPSQPHFASQKLHLTIAQVGDTRVLLCDTALGEVWALTDKHHAEARVEADRLRRMGTDRLISDSFGETRWMGAIENTRVFGDFEWKASGVTVEPEVTHRIIDGSEYAYLVFVTDGLTSLLSDQELVDLARNSADPTRAAKTIVHFGEDLGAQDNCTCIVVPLAGWGNVGGEDTTETRREYRRSQASRLNTRMQRM
ncbi:hypothetical protein CcaverHIS002_0605150 [Cutaneotrichosporon cavernicola]|uniref:PPM-type phosphatase domain-containing protein n=1 Tax=Cutaneotrichosporon cavernicola TaxID=279322 RepID=A0AA48L8W1_9TREE|nr:uncharacterized protein CcaverHIS019_0604600 [Cutaneotrichosporon cavernicola]BEI86228.1 hypothetical protein CcaverHIS002_0605150 [Cutaneotrichosporon cavernicola]BEI94001.1 hypothetical protein CcaverHIS019_0604600 [Cutaneotrichosporon cavernicola]BEJ01781.1 hypothetical protein CcaverHIS631_0604630 [Cutaneotrichosporon cavernicola]BEJ09548.1 hypothetical protein CcaverHIS641_0604630 [Cutaneotrichosporon cavernicola]